MLFQALLFAYNEHNSGLFLNCFLKCFVQIDGDRHLPVGLTVMTGCQSCSNQAITWPVHDVITKENFQTKPNKQSSTKTYRARDVNWVRDSINTV